MDRDEEKKEKKNEKRLKKYCYMWKIAFCDFKQQQNWHKLKLDRREKIIFLTRLIVTPFSPIAVSISICRCRDDKTTRKKFMVVEIEILKTIFETIFISFGKQTWKKAWLEVEGWAWTLLIPFRVHRERVEFDVFFLYQRTHLWFIRLYERKQ